MRKSFAMIGFVFFLLFATPAYAAEKPEIDAVGCDATNVFNGPIEMEVVANNLIWAGDPINNSSSFAEESFIQNAGRLYSDPCFDFLGAGYESALIESWNSAIFKWNIVLQMKPQYDITLKLMPCVMEHNGSDIWGEMAQSSYYISVTAGPIFLLNSSPIVKVKAFPGPYATPGFEAPFLLDARVVPTLKDKALKNKRLTFNGMWGTELVIKLPQTGELNKKGKPVYNLKQGDLIRIIVEVPYTNTVDIYFGPDAAILKYIGLEGTEYGTATLCSP